MAAPWTVLFRLRAGEVAVRCVRARGVLADAAARLASRMHGADAQDVRARHELGRAAELFALYGASANPMLPLLSVQHVPDGNHPVRPRLALSLFQSSRACAEEACGCVETCRVHLRTADDLLAVPVLPGMDGLLDVERFIALHAGVKAALDLARVSAALAITAHWLVR
ncbi:hypothetical protein PVAP13_5KG082800 [Panicum virgatum]|uniref:Uncharacterized protein n=1 Tax=Panicum virgatum TaxID=38727 RepID=A0A8T0S8S9_PANVG|nr:hypothetical protein PVAP13_5KG082800 [Panicum virgatum]